MTESTNNKSSRAGLWLAVFLFILSFGTGLLAGRFWNTKKQITNDQGEVQISKIINLYSQNRSSVADFNQFWDIWNKVKEKYVGQPVDEVKLFYGAMEGMVAGLGDPYSVYFPPVKAKEFAKDLSGEFEGIGAELGLKDNQPIIIAPLPGSPAEKAGLKAGDKIYSVNKEDILKLTLDEIVGKIRGPEGTVVILTISHDGMEKAQDVSVTRQKIDVPSVSFEMKPGNIAYLRVSYFNDKTSTEFDKAVKQILAKSPKGLVLDLREDPGGYLDTAVEVASEWIAGGVVVKEKYSNGKVDEYNSSGAHRLVDLKTIVLVDSGSASGSEIVAGALQDYGKATLVGEKTYGKGSVQEFEALPDGSALKITVAKWFTPKDRSIDKEGIMPDVVLDKMVEEVKDKQGKVTSYKDLGLAKALEMLK